MPDAMPAAGPTGGSIPAADESGPASTRSASTWSAPAGLDRLRPRFDRALHAFFTAQGARLTAIDEGLRPPFDIVVDLVAGGKRLRPAFCYWAWRGTGQDHDLDGPSEPEEPEAPIIVAGAALELLHVAALIHDDVIDASDRRRGRPSTHRRLADLHHAAEWSGSSRQYGEGGAILFGDLAMCWSDEMLRSARFAADELLPALHYFDLMRTEVMAGQYLDLTHQAAGAASQSEAMRVVRYKSAKYTVERPLHVGAALGGASEELLEAYTAFGVPLGEAFQLRDDVLGVFGDPETTGKPAGDDLREGKRTVLVAGALQNASAERAERFQRWFGSPELDDRGVAELREIIVETGALATVERLIGELTDTARTALAKAPIADERSRAALDALAGAATQRSV